MDLDCIIPKEDFSGKKLEVGHFRIFGCMNYSHVTLEKGTNSDIKTKKDIYVGYDETSIRIINPPLSKFGHMSKLGVMSKSGVHPVYL